MRLHARICAGLAAAALSGCSGAAGIAQRPAEDRDVDFTYRTYTQNWTAGDTYKHWFRAYNDGYRMTICGATAYRTGASLFEDEVARMILDRTRLRVGKDTLFTGVRERFNVVEDPGLARPARAKCTATDLPFTVNGSEALSMQGPRRISYGS
ncbi:hypothetical protein ACQ5SO_08175 [Rhodovulum sp. DZ06]|uniref:hypothetical protein n=1 Tax=Rhodovulum sp. DZ06 TaxID=3425126 RepID=UPI003D35139D